VGTGETTVRGQVRVFEKTFRDEGGTLEKEEGEKESFLRTKGGKEMDLKRIEKKIPPQTDFLPPLHTRGERHCTGDRKTD